MGSPRQTRARGCVGESFWGEPGGFKGVMPGAGASRVRIPGTVPCHPPAYVPAVLTPFLPQLYELDEDPKRKEFLDDLFSFMQKRGKGGWLGWVPPSCRFGARPCELHPTRLAELATGTHVGLSSASMPHISCTLHPTSLKSTLTHTFLAGCCQPEGLGPRIWAGGGAPC